MSTDPGAWLVPTLAAIGGGMAGSLTSHVLHRRDRRAARARRRLRGIEGRLATLEAENAALRGELAAVKAEWNIDTEETP